MILESYAAGVVVSLIASIILHVIWWTACYFDGGFTIEQVITMSVISTIVCFVPVFNIVAMITWAGLTLLGVTLTLWSYLKKSRQGKWGDILSKHREYMS